MANLGPVSLSIEHGQGPFDDNKGYFSRSADLQVRNVVGCILMHAGEDAIALLEGYSIEDLQGV